MRLQQKFHTPGVRALSPIRWNSIFVTKEIGWRSKPAFAAAPSFFQEVHQLNVSPFRRYGLNPRFRPRERDHRENCRIYQIDLAVKPVNTGVRVSKSV
jgi:hypothetical protein